MRYFFVFLVCLISTNIFGQNKDSLRSKLSDKYAFKRVRKTELLTGMSWQADWRDKENSQTRHYLEAGTPDRIMDIAGMVSLRLGFKLLRKCIFAKRIFIVPSWASIHTICSILG
jgi:hypothetical protein